MKAILTLVTLTMISTALQSATLAIIDSGTDLEHEMLAPLAWSNSVDFTMNSRDEDGNGYPDDKSGWNFAESNNRIFEPKYIGTFSQDVYRFFEIQQKSMLGQATEEEIIWMRGRVKDQQFLGELSIFGNFMHGTHVAGIASKGTQSRVLPIKIIPTEVQLPSSDDGEETQEEPKIEKFSSITMSIAKAALAKLAKENMKQLEEVAAYAAFHKADIANGSFGTGFPQAVNLIQMISYVLFKKLPTEEQAVELAVHFLRSLINNGNAMVSAAPKTLFVFAAGNDSSDNDKFPASPASIKADNVITVAATLADNQMASFSNFGANSVDVAAPGVAINSAEPGNRYIRISGTSQAAPYVARIATLVKEANPRLLPREIKKIITSTVDLRGYLTGKVKTGGIVNGLRAVKAAELTRRHPLEVAISQSHMFVKDTGSRKGRTIVNSVGEFVLPLPSMFKLN